MLPELLFLVREIDTVLVLAIRATTSMWFRKER